MRKAPGGCPRDVLVTNQTFYKSAHVQDNHISDDATARSPDAKHTLHYVRTHMACAAYRFDIQETPRGRVLGSSAR